MTIKTEIKGYVRFAGDFFATQFFGCKNEKELRAKAREFLGVKRLPQGTEVWYETVEVRYAA
ncbi:MAG: hypothetical protein PHE67_11765 [Campylobacterales bacterium]|nr:hypothetical protein [Campylobacterales bacterium]